MNKLKANGVRYRLGRIRRELYALSAEFGDVDNYFMTELEEASDDVQRLIDEITEWKNVL